MKAHIKDVLCSGNQYRFEYLINWLARAVQQPGAAAQERARKVMGEWDAYVRRKKNRGRLRRLAGGLRPGRGQPRDRPSAPPVEAPDASP